MKHYEIRDFIGGAPMYSTELARSERGIAWHNGQARIGEGYWVDHEEKWAGEILFSWKKTTLKQAQTLWADLEAEIYWRLSEGQRLS